MDLNCKHYRCFEPFILNQFTLCPFQDGLEFGLVEEEQAESIMKVLYTGAIYMVNTHIYMCSEALLCTNYCIIHSSVLSCHSKHCTVHITLVLFPLRAMHSHTG